MAVVGRVARPHGLRGHLVVDVETDFPDERFRPGEEMYARTGPDVRVFTVTAVRFQRERAVIALGGIDSIEAAETLAGGELRIPAERLARLPEGSYYRHDLVGCRVETADGSPVGIVAAVEGETGGSRLVVEASAGVVLIPLASAICRTIDTAHKRIVVDPPDGLLELNRKP
jgi:16S rRNA processing protein RimM